MPSPPSGLRPMQEFDPSEPAILHEVLTDEIVPWDWEKADDFRDNAMAVNDGRVLWRGLVFDGWDNVLGG